MVRWRREGLWFSSVKTKRLTDELNCDLDLELSVIFPRFRVSFKEQNSDTGESRGSEDRQIKTASRQCSYSSLE